MFSYVCDTDKLLLCAHLPGPVSEQVVWSMVMVEVTNKSSKKVKPQRLSDDDEGAVMVAEVRSSLFSGWNVSRFTLRNGPLRNGPGRRARLSGLAPLFQYSYCRYVRRLSYESIMQTSRSQFRSDPEILLREGRRGHA